MADDHARRWLPELRLRVYVDDLKSTLFGDQGTLACEAPLAAGALVHALESVHLQDSRGADGAPGGKSRQLASTAGLRMRLKAPLAKLGIGVVDVAVYLGVDVPCAARSTRRKRNQRDKRLAWRVAKLRRARHQVTHARVGIKRIFMQGVRAAALYGVRCMGLNDTRLLRLRRATCKAHLGSGDRRSLTLQLAMMGVDPNPVANSLPILAWATCIWESKVPSTLLKQAWKQQSMSLARRCRWAKEVGLAGATLLSARRAGWAWPAYHAFITAKGLQLDLRDCCPVDVQMMAARDWARAMWKKWTAAPERLHLASRPYIESLKELCRSRKKGTTARDRDVILKVASAGGWTQQRTHAAGLVDSPVCLACGAGVGDLHHRYHACPASAACRRTMSTRTWRHVAESQPASWLWSRGLLRAPAADWELRPMERALKWELQAEAQPLFEGMCFCDGSKLGTTEWAGTGLAALTLDQERPHVAAYGLQPVSLLVQRTVKRSEFGAFSSCCSTSCRRWKCTPTTRPSQAPWQRGDSGARRRGGPTPMCGAASGTVGTTLAASRHAMWSCT